MTAAATRPFPVPRTYQTWLRELAPMHPRRLWFGHFLVHRVEALVAVARPYRLEPFPLALLRRLFSTSSPANIASLHDLHFDRQLAGPLLRELAAAGLLRAEDDRWTLTDAGRQAMHSGAATLHAEERRVFYFADNAGAAATYLPLLHGGTPVAETGESWLFTPAILRECVARPAEWKQAIGFPTDVEAVVVEPRDAWRHVILDRAEHLPLLFIETAREGHSALQGYLVRGDTWALQREQPALMLGSGWPEVLPDFAEGLSPSAWREAWLAWCQSRQLSSPEASACQVDYELCKVHVRAPKAFIERLKTMRQEVLRGDTWLTLGAGRTRAAGCVEIREHE